MSSLAKLVMLPLGVFIAFCTASSVPYLFSRAGMSVTAGIFLDPGFVATSKSKII